MKICTVDFIGHAKCAAARRIYTNRVINESWSKIGPKPNRVSSNE